MQVDVPKLGEIILDGANQQHHKEGTEGGVAQHALLVPRHVSNRQLVNVGVEGCVLREDEDDDEEDVNLIRRPRLRARLFTQHVCAQLEA